MPLDQETITQQLDLLAAHRRTLAHLLQQAASYGGEVFTPPQTANGIAEARAEVQRMKAALREGGMAVEDAPGDEATPQVDPAQPQQAVSGQVNAQQSQGFINQATGPVLQNFGDQTNINTGGGSAIVGNQLENSPIVTGGTIQGDVIGQQTIYQRLPSWLRFLSAFVIVVVLAMVVWRASGGVAGMRTRLDAWGVLPIIQPEQPGETLLVIVPFYYTPNIPNTDAHGEIKKAIQAAAKDAELTNLRVALAEATLRADDRDGAEQIGSRYNASLVIWGDDTGVRVTVNFLNRRGTPEIGARDVAISETARTQLADPPAYNRFITDDLPHQLSFLALFAVGQSFYINQDYDAAIRVIERAVGAVTPGTSVEGLDDAYFRLGWLYQRPKNDAVQARVMYDQAIALDPKNVGAYNNRGNVRYAQGDLTGAIEDYNQVITLDAKAALAYYNRGNVRAAQGDLTGALADYDQAIALDPKNVGAYYNRGLARAAQGDLKGALADYDQAIALNPKLARAYNRRGSARDDQGDLKGALADYGQAIALDPKNATAYNNRGLVYQQHSDHTHAIADFEQVLRLTDDVELRREAEEQLRELGK